MRSDRQYVHAIDLVPTVLTALGVAAPEEINGVTQSPLEGISFAYSFAAPEEPTRREVQYFEMLGRRAIWHKDWKAVADHRPTPGRTSSTTGGSSTTLSGTPRSAETSPRAIQTSSGS